MTASILDNGAKIESVMINIFEHLLSALLAINAANFYNLYMVYITTDGVEKLDILIYHTKVRRLTSDPASACCSDGHDSTNTSQL